MEKFVNYKYDKGVDTVVPFSRLNLSGLKMLPSFSHILFYSE